MTNLIAGRKMDARWLRRRESLGLGRTRRGADEDPGWLEAGAVVPRHQTKAEVAVNLLRERIRAGVLQPGQHLRLGDLTEELGMSVTPIREALRLLQSDGTQTSILPAASWDGGRRGSRTRWLVMFTGSGSFLSPWLPNLLFHGSLRQMSRRWRICTRSSST